MSSLAVRERKKPSRPHIPLSDYPSSDGEPMAETDFHVREIAELVLLFRRYFAARPDVYVAGNNFVYYEEDVIASHFSPDVYVVMGASNELRRSFFTWKDGAVPTVVFEMCLRGTWKNDMGEKKERCEKLGVKEYYLYDPQFFHARPLKGYRLDASGTYQPVAPDARGFLLSEQLQLKLRLMGDGKLGIFDPVTEEPILRSEEAIRRAEEMLAQKEEALAREEEARKHEADARKAAEAEVARLKAEIQRLTRKNGAH